MLRRYALLSDTHNSVHARVHELCAGTECLLHAGDVGDEGTRRELAIQGELFAVCGNTDYLAPDLPIRRVVDLPFGRVGIAHGHRFSADHAERAEQLRRHFEPDEVRVIVYGHSHLQHLEFRSGVWLVNPGSAGRPRFGTVPSMCLMTWDSDHDLLSFDFKMFPWRET